MPITAMEFFRVVVKLMWNSSGYSDVDVEFFRGIIIKNICILDRWVSILNGIAHYI